MSLGIFGFGVDRFMTGAGGNEEDLVAFVIFQLISGRLIVKNQPKAASYARDYLGYGAGEDFEISDETSSFSSRLRQGLINF